MVGTDTATPPPLTPGEAAAWLETFAANLHLVHAETVARLRAIAALLRSLDRYNAP